MFFRLFVFLGEAIAAFSPPSPYLSLCKIMSFLHLNPRQTRDAEQASPSRLWHNANTHRYTGRLEMQRPSGNGLCISLEFSLYRIQTASAFQLSSSSPMQDTFTRNFFSCTFSDDSGGSRHNSQYVPASFATYSKSLNAYFPPIT